MKFKPLKIIKALKARESNEQLLKIKVNHRCGAFEQFL